MYLNGYSNPNRFDIVKWENHEPYEVTDFYTGQMKMSTRSCFSIGFLTWDEKEYEFEFESCGLRYLEYRIDGLEKFILDFCEMMREELRNSY